MFFFKVLAIASAAKLLPVPGGPYRLIAVLPPVGSISFNPNLL